MGGGESGEVDAQRQAQRYGIPQEVEEAAEQQRVEEERDALDRDRHGQPGRRGVPQQFDGALLAGQPRHDEEQRHDDDQEDDRRAPGMALAR